MQGFFSFDKTIAAYTTKSLPSFFSFSALFCTFEVSKKPLVLFFMKNPLLLLLLFCRTADIFTQTPPNDECSAPIELGVAPVCTPTEYSNLGATSSIIGTNNRPSCFSTADGGNDVWFTFVCPPAPLDFRIELTPAGAAPIVRPQLAVYRGECEAEGLAELDCTAGAGALVLDVQGLTPGAVYFIRVSSAGPVGNAGTFNLCVSEMPPILTVDQGGSTLCFGTLYDSGGPDGNYQPNEDHTFVICPNAPTSCLTFTLEYYHLDAGGPFSPGFDVLSFYDGPDTNSPLLAQINGTQPGVGVDGGGGVCFRVQATGSCLTVQFQSDATLQLEGFKGKWECSPKPCVPYDDISIEKDVTPQDIADALAAPGALVTVKDMSRCPYGAYGTFALDSDNNEIGLQQGLVLTTGLIDLIPGPNDDNDVSFPHFTPGDPDLDYLSTVQGNGLPSEDACVIELDVFVSSDELAFEYVFGSEEYPEYANSLYNDIFAFLASGPGISGDPNLGGAVNIAVLPGGNTPVQINSVNNLINWPYYRNTEISQTLQYDGFTSDFMGIKKSLTARVDVVPCHTYRLKLAIADRQDPLFDSGVFISEVRAGAPELSVQLADNLPYLVEGCTEGSSRVLVRLRKPKTKAATYTLTLGGSATPGEDYLTDLPPTLMFQPGDSLFVFTITPIADSLEEGTERITISLSGDFGCGATVFQTLELDLLDGLRVRINEGADTLFFCPGAVVQLQADGAATYFWQPPLLVSNPNIGNPTVTPTQDLALKVIGALGTCMDTARIFLKRIASAAVSIVAPDTLLCQGDTVNLLAITSPPGLPVAWTPKSRLSAPNGPEVLAYPLTTTTYSVSPQVAGCPPQAASITLSVDTLFFPRLKADTIVCQGYPVLLAEAVPPNSNIYRWTPAEGLNNAAIPNPIAYPRQTTTYHLKVTSANGGCSRIDSVRVEVIPAAVNILQPDTLVLCLGDSVLLQAQTSPSGGVLQWSPSMWITPSGASDVWAKPIESVTWYVSYSINGCLVTDSVRVWVDSLPPLDLRLEPYKERYCPGDTIYLLSKTYDPGDFPGLTHRWEPFAGQLTPTENWNMVIVATQTHMFRRETRSFTGACRGQAEILVPVDTPPQLSAEVNPPVICPGQTAQIRLTVSPPDQPIEWEDPTGSLSCKNCTNPIAAPAATSVYRVNTPGATCPAGIDVVVEVLPSPALDLGPQTICLGDAVRLNSAPAAPNYTYRWEVLPPGDPNSLNTFNEPSPIAHPATTTTYRVSVDGQCPRQGEITVTVNSASVDVGPDQTVCSGTSVRLSAVATPSSPEISGTFTWLPGGQTGSILTVFPGTTTTYTAVYRFPPDCAAADSLTVTVLPGATLGPISADLPLGRVLCEGTRLTLRVSVTPPDARLTWFENGRRIEGVHVDSLVRTPVGDVAPLVTAYVVVAETADGCRDTTAPFEVPVRRCIVFPNAFTPDGDGHNDHFGGPIAFGEDNFEVLDLRIFNRWGQQVFASSPTQSAWDGRINGQPAPGEVYVYFAVVRFANGEEQTFKGDITLLR